MTSTTQADIAGRLIKWSIELSEFDIRYQSRGAIKSQFLADFIVELTIPSEEDHTKQWTLYIDGSSNKEGCGAGIRLEAEDGTVLEHSLHLSFKTNNNQSEYEALVAGLQLCLELQIYTIKVYCDSLLVVQQVNDQFQVRDPLLSKYLLLVKNLISQFKEFEIQHIPREQNQRADILSKLDSTQSEISTLHQFTINSPSIDLTKVLSVTQESDWRIDFINYLQTSHIPETVENVKRFRRQATFFTLLNGALYRRGYTRPLLKCLSRSEAEIALSEAHEGICETHTGARSLSSKILRAGFFWPSLKQDSENKVRACINCQKHAPTIHIPAEDMHHSNVTWPFHQWGLDILGPFPTAPGQTNGLAEAANKVILHALKKKLDDAKGLWADLIPEVLWGYNTTPQSSTKETPFRLVYGSKAMIPLEISQSSIRTQLVDHNESRRTELDIIEEVRDIATLRQRAAQQTIARHYNKSVRSRTFNKGDLVVRKTELARRPPSHGKLAANWEGPYRVTQVLGNGAYKLETLTGTVLPNTWNVASLKKFYS
ncbi:uncharacterized protein LOC107607204 [Arachis ipaensis]|uniref:uncharacterized protein LOC107607204 n=1 Tax=Arachis ipaensis TaxID=130454 RepID=UPI0007AF399E|nr:uncharacterized protein LOC107607204 [Arachis ipaensis]XP_025664878.1 uncharacterized protein LOC112763413 [Arachis hypogaea]